MRTVSGGRHTAAAAVRARTGLLLIAGAVVLSGCASAPDPVPSETPSAAAPVFASDEEALAAATEAYAAYLTMSSQILNDGGSEASRIAPYVSDLRLPAELESFAEFAEAGARSVGDTSFKVFKLQSAEYSTNTMTSIVLYLCEDVSAVDVLDEAGTSLVSPSRKPFTPFEVTIRPGPNQNLVVDERELWEGATFC